MEPQPLHSCSIMNDAFALILCILSFTGSMAAIAGAAEQCKDAGSDGSCDTVHSYFTAATEEEVMDSPNCEDQNPRCADWAAAGECAANPNYMVYHCPVSCDSCPAVVDGDNGDLLKAVAEYGEPQTVAGKDAEKTMEVVRKTVTYMKNDIYGPNPTHALSGEVLAECVNREELCAFWAAIGECEANKAYMKLKCAPSCQTCDMIDIKSRCPPLGDDVRPALLPGELNAMFELILATAPGNQTGDAVHIGEGMTNYSVHVHSRTRPREEDEEPIITRERDLAEPPWIITFEDFLTEEECAHLIQLGFQNEFKRSEDVGALQPDGSCEFLLFFGLLSQLFLVI